MRISRALLAVALALVPLTVGAQPTPAQPTPAQPAATTPTAVRGWTGAIDFGIRGTSADGDAARYERYRDLGDGLFVQGLRLNRDHNGWLLDLTADHVGRRDQRYLAGVERPNSRPGSCGTRFRCC
jgi:hypothetical protein